MTTTPVDSATPTPPISVSPPDQAIVCALCGSDNVRASGSRRGADLLPLNLGKTAFRCRDCRKRFYLKPPVPLPDPAPQAKRSHSGRSRDSFWKRPDVRRLLGDISVVGGALIVFAIFLYLLVASTTS